SRRLHVAGAFDRGRTVIVEQDNIAIRRRLPLRSRIGDGSGKRSGAGFRTDVDQKRRVAVGEPTENVVRRDFERGIELDHRGRVVEEAGGHGRMLTPVRPIAGSLGRPYTTRDSWSAQTKPDITLGRKRVDFGGSISPCSMARAKAAGVIGGSQIPVPASPFSTILNRTSGSER